MNDLRPPLIENSTTIKTIQLLHAPLFIPHSLSNTLTRSITTPRPPTEPPPVLLPFLSMPTAPTADDSSLPDLDPYGCDDDDGSVSSSDDSLADSLDGSLDHSGTIFAPHVSHVYTPMPSTCPTLHPHTPPSPILSTNGPMLIYDDMTNWLHRVNSFKSPIQYDTSALTPDIFPPITPSPHFPK